MKKFVLLSILILLCTCSQKKEQSGEKEVTGETIEVQDSNTGEWRNGIKNLLNKDNGVDEVKYVYIQTKGTLHDENTSEKVTISLYIYPPDYGGLFFEITRNDRPVIKHVHNLITSVGHLNNSYDFIFNMDGRIRASDEDTEKFFEILKKEGYITISFYKEENRKQVFLCYFGLDLTGFNNAYKLYYE